MNPFATDAADKVDSLGEIELIQKLKTWLGDANPAAPYGIGDDCAVLPASRNASLLTADPVIYGQHFDDSIAPDDVAKKLIRRNLSDIAAMGGIPRHAVLCLALDPSVSIKWIERFYHSIAAEAIAHDCAIVGGDVSSAPNFLGAFLTLHGEMPDAQSKPLLRAAAPIGARVFVTGSLGGTRARKHFDFTPRLAEGRWLARSGHCSSCCDLSDGLGKDYRNLLSPGQALQLDCAALPLSEDCGALAAKTGKSPAFHALNDGEDYELLFALASNTDPAAFAADWQTHFATPLTAIGTIAQSAGASLVLENATPDIVATGYEHLR